MDVNKGEELTILKFEDRASKDPVTFGSSVCLQTPLGFFLSFNSNGELKVEKNVSYDVYHTTIAKLTKWNIYDAKNFKNTNIVTPFDDIVLKSPFGEFFQVQQNDVIGANGKEANENCIFKIVKAGIPFLPDWLFKRPYLNHNNITYQYQGLLNQTGKRQAEERPKPLGSFPIDIQETFLIEDLLYAMSSIEGQYIKRKQVQSIDGTFKSEFSIEPYLPQSTADFSLQFLVNKMLPLCNNHDTIQEFVNIHSQFEFGLVSHALCDAIRILLKEYLLLVTQLDTEFMKSDLTLQKVWFYVQSSLRIMENLKRLTSEAGNKKGGALLNVIYRLMVNSSDKSIRDLFELLLEKSAQPYFSILKKWIFQGILDDPF